MNNIDLDKPFRTELNLITQLIQKGWYFDTTLWSTTLSIFPKIDIYRTILIDMFSRTK